MPAKARKRWANEKGKKWKIVEKAKPWKVLGESNTKKNAEASARIRNAYIKKRS